MRALIIAFSMYSRVPMPRTDFDDRGMKYAMACFPVVGALLGLLYFGLFHLSVFLRAPEILRAALLFALPVLYTGGIHMDGFMDTEDAIHSYGDLEKRLQILKDSHVGAFAVICALCYAVLFTGFSGALTEVTIGASSCVFVLSRILSAIAVVSFPKATKKGSLRTFSDLAGDHVLQILIAELIAFSVLVLVLFHLFGAVLLVTCALVFLWYHHLSVKTFGGITGDLAGYFVCQCELWGIGVLVVLDLLLSAGGLL